MSVLFRKLLRTIVINRGQTFAVVLVVMTGTACYIMYATLLRDLVLTRDTYYSQARFADFEIMAERVPTTALFKLEDIPGVRKVRGRIVKDANLDIEGVDEPRIGRIVSMPERNLDVLHDIVIRDGRYFDPGAQNEVILSEKFAIENSLAPGDSISVTLDGRKHKLRIVGLGLSPEYVYLIRNVQEMIPSPRRFGILWVTEDFAETALDMKAACNNIIGSADNQEQLDAILDSAEDLLESYGVFAKIKREDQISNRFLSDEIKGLSVAARVVPTLFLGIAALVIMVLLNRMVRNERTQIGLMKAYGYSSFAVGFHYVQFAMILAAAGCVLGFLVGQLFARQMIKVYVEFYSFPLLRSRVYPDVFAQSMMIAISFSLAGAAAAAYRAGRIHPAESMRPEAPRRGRRTPLDHWPALWSRLSFTWKMIARNVFRHRFRTALNCLGAVIATGLLVVGFNSLDAFSYLIDFQFGLTQREDVKINLMTENSKEALYEASRLDHVRYAEPLLQYPFTLSSAWRKKDTVIVGLPRNARLQKLIDADMNEIDVGESGLVLSSSLAADLGVGPGDMVMAKPLMGRITDDRVIPVSKTVKQYLGWSGYMNIDALSAVLDESYAMNAVLLDVQPGAEQRVVADLKDVPAVASVEVRRDTMQSLQDTLVQSMFIASVMIIFFSGVIAFSIIYNVTAVSLAERQRELASLRVLGFSKQEVGAILYKENFVAAGIGILLGLPFGVLLCRALINAYDTDLYRLPFHIEPRTFVVAALATSCFVALANLAVRRKIHTLDLVEVLKSRE